MIVASCAWYFCSLVVVVDDGVAGLIVVVGH